MALGNWATRAIDEKGAPTNGTFRSPGGVVVEVYKNLLYVHDERAWTEGGFSKPVVADIRSGIVQYKDVEIVALRGPQEGVYAFVWSMEYPKDAPHIVTGMIGVGVYGYSGGDDPQWVGVLPSSVAWLKEQASETATETDTRGSTARTFEYHVLDIPDCLRAILLDPPNKDES